MKSIKLFLITMISLVLIGCNTVSGFGKDVQTAGEVITDSVDNDENK